ncbi:MAG: hypothetical protein CR986_02625 [Ignavibacteriae bacterium]|nr:MAG: hypothetical protein CR986_02625 [Ignavibacteriota bacterium]
MQKLLLLIAISLNILTFGQKMNYKIIPTPQKIKVNSNKIFTLKNELTINFDKKNLVNKSTITKTLKSCLLNKNTMSNFQSDKELADINLILITDFDSELNIPKNFIEEAYHLEISDKNISVRALTSKGIYYGVLTLCQIIESAKSKKLAQLEIVDYPDMKFRGISDDISRGQVSTLKNFKRIIRFISEYKMNTYMPYMEDLIQFDKYPEIGKGRGALSKNEIKEIVKFAEEHFVEVIPIFQTLGHYENILSQSEFIELADWSGAASLDVTNPKTYSFLENLLKEIFELFPSKYFHIGADESYDVGYGNSRKLVEETDLATVHAEHYKKVYDICKENGKEVMMYGDMILDNPGILDKISDDIIIVNWKYFPRFNYTSTRTFNKHNFPYIVSPSVWNFNAAFPENFLAVPNIQTFIEDGLRNNSLGMLNSSWGDYGAETFREYNLYGYAWSAQCAWNIAESNILSFNNSFFKQFFGTEPNSVKKIFDELNNPVNQMVWNNVWRNPLLGYRKQDWRQYKFPELSKFYGMLENNEILQNVNKLRRTASKNKGFIDLLEFTGKLKNWFILKQEAMILLSDALDSIEIDYEKLNNLVKQNIQILTELKTEYSTLWKRTNKEDNLWMIEDKFTRMIENFEDIKKQADKKNIRLPLLQSKWIYLPSNDEKFIWRADFRKVLNIDDEILKAQLQIIGHTFARLFVNGKEIDSVYTKRSGSLWVEQQRVKLLDIKEYLCEGENEIILEAKNYYNQKTPGVNVYGRIITESDTIMISSNEDWQVRETSDDEWTKVELRENRLEIIEPDLDKNRKSWIER